MSAKKYLGFMSGRPAAVMAMLVVAGALLAVMTSGLAGGQANTSRQQENGSNSALKVSPLRTDVSIRPGETRKVTISVQNVTTNPLTLKPIENDFIAGSSENGIPDIILDEGKYAPTHSLKRFMVPLDNITLQPGEIKPVEVSIVVPNDAQAGGYYGALRFVPANTAGGENVNIAGSVASLILLTVPGNVVESLHLTNFDIRQNDKTVSRLSSPDKVDVQLRLENKGNVHVSPFGSVNVQKGGKLVYSAKVNDVKPAGVVLPDSSRKWSIPINKLGGFGKYEISATLGYGGSGETIEVKKTIWLIPTAFIVALVAIIVGLVVVITLVVLGLRSYKRRIMRRARRR